ncbi:MAG: TadE/TadG family type IV pilus assembly protein [Alphaproteobacteria bacterium]|nr:TadE/TadG family type IV pilus assembly protein [Alphaproteobacteria bacterium]
MNAFQSRLRAFLRDTRGLAALEFALILPMMVVVLFGSVELTEVLTTKSRVENTAAAMADVVSRDTVIEDDEIDDLWAASGTLMYPNSAGPLKLRVTSVQVETPTRAVVLWSEGHNGYTARSAGSVMSAPSLPAGLMIPGTSVIVAETDYRYTPPIGVFLDVAFDLKHIEYRRPRIADPVTRN